MKKLLIVLLILALLIALGALLFRIFVTDRITDKGGMENPEYSDAVSRISPLESARETLQILQEDHHGTV